MDGYVDAELIDLALEGLRELGVFDEKVTVERTGYPDHLYRRTFRAVRDGKIIAIIGVYEYPPKPDVSSGSPTNTENATAQRLDTPRGAEVESAVVEAQSAPVLLREGGSGKRARKAGPAKWGCG